jgi:hypothetical protein
MSRTSFCRRPVDSGDAYHTLVSGRSVDRSQQYRTSILLFRAPHLLHTTRVRNHGTKVSCGYFDTSINAV